jgi:hypothetical protein
MAKVSAIMQAYTDLEALKLQIAEAEAKASALRSFLVESVPVGETVDGVKNASYERPSVSYKDALAKVIGTLVPKAKRTAANGIVAEATKTNLVPKFVLAETKADAA